jgi:hypothetical protein
MAGSSGGTHRVLGGYNCTGKKTPGGAGSGTPFHVSPALGLGSTDKGGAASTAAGGRFAMGNTEEALIVARTSEVPAF